MRWLSTAKVFLMTSLKVSNLYIFQHHLYAYGSYSSRIICLITLISLKIVIVVSKNNFLQSLYFAPWQFEFTISSFIWDLISAYSWLVIVSSRAPRTQKWFMFSMFQRTNIICNNYRYIFTPSHWTLCSLQSFSTASQLFATGQIKSLVA